METTAFDKILSREIPAEIVYENDSVLAFKDMNPQAPVHILIIPKQKVTGMAHVGVWQENQAGRFFQSVARVARELGLESDGYRIVINNGPNGGQEVNYLHAHLLGGRQLFWPPG